MRAPFATLLAIAASTLTPSCGSTAGDGSTRGNEPAQPARLDTGLFEDGAVVASTRGHAQHDGFGEKPLIPAVHKGLLWLRDAQSKDGGFGQDGVDPRQEVGLESQGTDVANTALAALAMLRAGTTPTDGTYTDSLLRAIDYVLGHIEKAPAEGLSITDRTGTQIQRKLGPYVDTFLASMLLSEVKGKMPDANSEARVVAALDKCVDKIEKNQQQDGSWNAGGGWAPIISTSLASRSLFNARENGVQVDSEVLDKVDDFTKKQFDGKAGSFKVGEGDAGVALYKVAQAYEQASRDEQSRKDNSELLASADQLLQTSSFQSGFGSMGGEEFISYMNIGDSLVREGGEKWHKWNDGIKERLCKLQNADGTWAGHHCITGRVACTSAAILTLLTERTVAPAVQKGEGD